MASPAPGYTDGEPDPEGGQYTQDGGYEQTQQQAAAAAAAPGAKKKRAYAGQAYEFGTGANAALGGQQAGGGQPPQAVGGYGYPGAPQAQQQQPSYGMPQQAQYADPAMQNQAAHLQNQAAQPAYGQPQYGAAQGGYEPPSQGYPSQPQQAQQQPPLQQFSQMSIGGQQPAQPAPGQLRLNPLQPVDISMQGQPFHVTDLDQPPPPIILPPNVSFLPKSRSITHHTNSEYSPLSHHLPTPTAHQNTSAAP